MTNRVVLGALPGGGHGLRVSRPGFDVLNTGLAPKQLAFDSRWPAAMRLVKSGLVSSGSGATIDFGETLDVEPLCIVVRKNNEFNSLDFTFATIRKNSATFGIQAGSAYSYYVVAP